MYPAPDIQLLFTQGLLFARPLIPQDHLITPQLIRPPDQQRLAHAAVHQRIL
jgi:hypothetical protein